MGSERAEPIWPDPNWRDTQDEPCTCRPGDGTEQCDRFDECYEAFNRAQQEVIDGFKTEANGYR